MSSTDGVDAAISRDGQPRQGLQQAAYMQEKLEATYKRTYQFLAPRKDWIEEAEHVLVWTKPLVSAFLFLVVHWIFIVFAQNSQTLVTRLGYFLFWAIVADILWRAAHNQFGTGKKKDESTRRGIVPITRQKRVVSLESAMILQSTPLKEKELPAFEVICLWLAEYSMWLDNIFIALRHWSVNDPKLFCVCIGFPGLLLSLLGKYFPTIVLAYIIVIGLLTWPYIEYHKLGAKLVLYITDKYPQALERLKIAWSKFKAFVSKDTTDFPEVSLTSGMEGAEAETFEQWPSSPGPSKGPSPPAPNKDTSGPPASRTDPPPASGTDLPPDEVPSAPGMSILQDSVLGMMPNAFLSPDDSFAPGSLSLGPGDMPSITDLDHSISLPQFPSMEPGAGGGALEQSISLPQFPGSRARAAKREGDHVQDIATMPSIDEEDDITLPTRLDREIDPLLDSYESDFTDGRSHSRQPPMKQITANTSEIPSRFDTGYGTRDSVGCDDRRVPDTFVAPPPYHAAVDGSDGGVVVSVAGHAGSEDELNTETKGGYWLRQRNPSKD